jgi:hypothetical protein
MYNSGKFNALNFNAVTADNAIKLFSNSYETINAQLSAAQIFYLTNNSYEIVNEEVELVSGVILVANPSENISSQCQIVGVVFLTENITANLILGANYYFSSESAEAVTASVRCGAKYYLANDAYNIIIASIGAIYSVEIKNIEISVTLPVNSKLVIDSDNYLVLLNGNNIIEKHLGAWLDDLNRNVISIEISGAGLTKVNSSILYTERYL